jgi:hypothetical protein
MFSEVPATAIRFIRRTTESMGVTRMNASQKRLYSQIHPAKLFTDISMSVVSLYLFWLHNIVPALLLHILPSLVVSYVIIRFSNLEKYAQSSIGGYLAKYMTTRMQLLRLFGDVVTVVGAWFQMLWIIAIGLVVVLLGWMRGRIFA